MFRFHKGLSGLCLTLVAVLLVRLKPIDSLESVTVASATTAPLGSMTVPRKDVVPVCAAETRATSNTATRVRQRPERPL